MKRMDLEFKVGIFVAIGIAIFMSMIFSLKELKYAQQKYTMTLRFNFANGIEISAPVRFAGVQAGEVKDIHVIYDDKNKKTVVDLEVWLDKKVRVEQDAEAFINTLGLIGEKYVEILPGTPGSPAVKPKGMLYGRESVPIEKLTEKAYNIACGLEGTMGDAKKLFSSANTVMDKVKSGEGTIGKLFMDDALYNELEDFIKDLKAHPWKLLNKPRGEK